MAAKKAGAALLAAGTDDGWVRAAAAKGRTVRPPTPGRATARAPRAVARPQHQVGWQAIPGGTELEVELVGTSRKGKWRVKLVDREQGVGVVGSGTPPTDAAVGQRHKVVVTAGGDPKNLGFRWP